jgi:hypothetical protein
MGKKRRSTEVPAVPPAYMVRNWDTSPEESGRKDTDDKGLDKAGTLLLHYSGFSQCFRRWRTLVAFPAVHFVGRSRQENYVTCTSIDALFVTCKTRSRAFWVGDSVCPSPLFSSLTDMPWYLVGYMLLTLCAPFFPFVGGTLSIGIITPERVIP